MFDFIESENIAGYVVDLSANKVCSCRWSFSINVELVSPSLLRRKFYSRCLISNVNSSDIIDVIVRRDGTVVAVAKYKGWIELALSVNGEDVVLARNKVDLKPVIIAAVVDAVPLPAPDA